MNGDLTKISVVVTTYKGDKFIIEQLDSIRNQTMPVDEVIIRDDCSPDSTYNIVEEYISDNHLTNWKLFDGEVNVGWKINFKKVLEMATGDIIFLCDQDDIWINTKVEEMITIFKSNPDIELLESDYDFYIDEEVKERKHDLEVLQRKAFDCKFFHTTRPGAVFAIKKILLEELLPYWNDELPHDAQLWVLANVRHSLFISNRPLILYRRHENTATGRDELGLQSKVRNIQYEKALIKLVSRYEMDKQILTSNELRYVYKAEKYIVKRLNLLMHRTLRNAICVLPYISYYIKPKTMIGDIYVSLLKKY